MKKGIGILVFLMVVVFILPPFVLTQKEDYNSQSESISEGILTSEKEMVSIGNISDCNSYLAECQGGRQEACLKYDFNCNPTFNPPEENFEIKEEGVIFDGEEINSKPAEILNDAEKEFGQIDNLRLIKEKGKVQFKANSQREGKILNLFPISYKVTYIYDKEGNYIREETSWWDFLVVEIPREVINNFEVSDEEIFLDDIEIEGHRTNRCNRILFNGNPKQKLNFVFISDGFNTKIEFLNRVEEFISLNNLSDNLSFLNYYPLSQFKDFYNIYTFYDPSIDWGCDSGVSINSNALCANKLTILDKVAEYCNWGLESDYLIILSNKNYRSWADSFGSEDLEKVKHLGISVLSGEILDVKKMFLHELGHSLGELSDEYVEIKKDQYKPIAGIGAKNIDPEGCPSWCSGTLNVNNMFFESYEDYVDCTVNLNINNPEDDSEFLACFNAPFYPTAMNNCLNQVRIVNDITITQCYESLYNSSVPQQVWDMCSNENGRFLCQNQPNIDLGINCLQGTGCYWPAGGMNGFRSLSNSLMRNHLKSQNLGPYNEQVVIENINRKIQERQLPINQIELNILEFSNFSFPSWWANLNLEGRYLRKPFKVIFKVVNQDNDTVIISNNYRNYVTASSVGLIFKNLETKNLELYFTYDLDEKNGQTQINPGNYQDITFIVKYDGVGVNKTYRFYLYNLTFEEI